MLKKKIFSFLISFLIMHFCNGQSPTKLEVGLQFSPELTGSVLVSDKMYFRHAKESPTFNGGILLTLLKDRIMFKLGLSHFTHTYRYEFRESDNSGAFLTEMFGTAQKTTQGINLFSNLNYSIFKIKHTIIYSGFGMSAGRMYQQKTSRKGLNKYSNGSSTRKIGYLSNSIDIGIGARNTLGARWTLDSRIKYKRTFFNYHRFYLYNKTYYAMGLDISLNYLLFDKEPKKTDLIF